jgi:hypothetical protein
VKDILFSPQGSHKKLKVRGDRERALKKCFKSLAKYVKLKLRVRAFLSEELDGLNQEFVEL